IPRANLSIPITNHGEILRPSIQCVRYLERGEVEHICNGGHNRLEIRAAAFGERSIHCVQEFAGVSPDDAERMATHGIRVFWLKGATPAPVGLHLRYQFKGRKVWVGGQVP